MDVASHVSTPDRTNAIARRGKNLSAPSLIERTRLNGNDSHPRISSEPLIEDEGPNPTATPKYVYKYTCSSTM